VKVYRGRGYRVLYDVVRDRGAEQDTPSPMHRTPVRASADAVRYFIGLQRLGIVPSERESFCVLMLDSRHRTVAFHVASIGTLNSAPIAPASIFRPALAVGAHSIVLAHNHPSGDCTPSPEDRRVTDRLTQAGELLGITVLDHVVIGADRYFAFADGRHFPIEP
jgi:DNA repair protein RadC